MQKDLYIFMRLPDGRRLVAARVLHARRADGSFVGHFRYERQWLDLPDAFPLDPVNLPLGTRVFQVTSRTGLWGVLEDGLPDAWGRRLLQARHGIDVSGANNFDLLLLTGWAEPGATGFARTPQMRRKPLQPMDLDMTGQAISASEAFEQEADTGHLPDFFISGGSSAGGARPKVLACSGTDQYLVKFPSINDPGPDTMARLEFFGLSCIRAAGIPVPRFFPVTAAGRRLALAIKRFDISDTGGRLHFLSMQSLLGSEEQLGLPYAKMADILRRVSAEPEQDIGHLFKQMVVNILIANRDDHLKNFAMIYSPPVRGFRLTPAYDVVPNLWQQEHILSVADKTSRISREDLLSEGRRFGLSGRRCRRLLDEAVTGVARALDDNREVLEQLAAARPLCRRLLEGITDRVQRHEP
jgi:serine/threonine-protein kinase HipA